MHKTEYEVYEKTYRSGPNEDVEEDVITLKTEQSSNAAFACAFQLRVQRPLRDIRIDRVVFDEKGEISRERVK